MTAAAGRPCRALLSFEAGPSAAAIHGALSPEATEPLLRGRASVRVQGAHVEVELVCEDAVALRAGVNTYLRAVAAADAALAALRPDPGRKGT